MEFIKVGKNYMIKNSNGRIISEEEKIKLENEELTLTNEDCCCPEKIKKVSKNNKRLKEIKKKKAALNNEVQDDTIKETNKLI